MGRRLRDDVVDEKDDRNYPRKATTLTTVMARIKQDNEIDDRIMKVVENNRVYYRCTACGYATARTFNVARHYVRKHTKLQTPKTCTRCDQHFKTKGDFYEHRKVCHEVYIPPPSKKPWIVVSVKEEPEEDYICESSQKGEGSEENYIFSAVQFEKEPEENHICNSSEMGEGSEENYTFSAVQFEKEPEENHICSSSEMGEGSEENYMYSALQIETKPEENASFSPLHIKEEPEENDICNSPQIQEDPDSHEELDAEEESAACDEFDAERESDACDESDTKRTSKSCEELDIKESIRLLDEEDLLKFEEENSLSSTCLEGSELYLGMDIIYNQEEPILHDIHDDFILPSWALDKDIEDENENTHREGDQTLKQSPHEIIFRHSLDILTDS